MDTSPLLTASEVARVFGVRPSTIARWAREGNLKAVVLPSGHRRYRAVDVEALIDAGLGAAS